MNSLIYISIQLISLAVVTNAWHRTVKFNFTVANISDSHVNVFESSYLENDYFSMISSNRNNHMEMDSQSVYIGGRNHLYQLGLPDLEHQSNLSWASSGFNVMQCLNRSIIRNKDECANYIKLYLKLDEDTFQVCSTNALNPKCRFYQLKNKQSQHMSRFLKRRDDSPTENSLSRAIFLNETSGLGYSPLKAHENKYVYNQIHKKNLLFTANTIDLNRYFTSINRYINQEQIATNVNDDSWINRAEFVDSFSNDERVFFVFNEQTKTERSNPHDGLAIKQNVATISQICLNDPGAPLNSLRNIWTSYLKSRLNCVYDASKANDVEFDSVFQSNSKLFYFNEIKSISQLYTTKVPGSSKTTSYFYAVFTTSKYSVTASAICKFSLEQIMQSFHGDYKHRQSSSPIPNPRPSQCPNKLTYQHLVFSRKHILMENSVESEALIVETSRNNRFMSLDVDYQVSNYNEKSKSDVLLVGTDNGKVLSFVIQTQSNRPTLVHSEEVNVFSHAKTTLARGGKFNQNSLVNIKLYKKNEQNTLILMTRSKLISIPASYCKQKLDMSQCDNQVYPYCVWSIKMSKCVEFTSSFVNDTHVESASRIQNLTKTMNSSFIDLTNKLQEPNRYTSVPLVSLDNLVVEKDDISVRVNAAKEIQFTLDLGTLICVAFVFVAVSAVIGSAFTILVIKCFRSKRKQFKLKQLNLSSFFSKKSLADVSSASSDEPIDKFENLYSKVKPKNRLSVNSHVEVRALPRNNMNMALEGSNYSAITELITQQHHSEPDRYVSMMATSEIQPYSTQGEIMNGERNTNNGCLLNNRFLDYDDSEYFTIKKSHLDNQNNLRISSSDSASTSSVSSGSGSGQTQSSIQSTAMLVKSQKHTAQQNQQIYERYMPSPPIYSITNKMTGNSHLSKYYL